MPRQNGVKLLRIENVKCVNSNYSLTVIKYKIKTNGNHRQNCRIKQIKNSFILSFCLNEIYHYFAGITFTEISNI